MKDIPGYEGRYAVTDDGRVWSHKNKRFKTTWKHASGYPMAGLGHSKQYRVHRLVACAYLGLDLASPKEVDHKDRNRTNNHVSNLRICETYQQRQNMSMRSDNTSGFKGVVWDNYWKRWYVRVYRAGKSIYVGRFKDKILAAKAYDLKAKEEYGEFAAVNFP